MTAQKILSDKETTFFDRESAGETKINTLLKANRHDTCGPSHDPDLGAIYRAKNNNQGCLLFKTLYTNACSFDCKYCINTRKEKKSTYTPAELAKTFMRLYKMNLVEGLFLSSAIPKDPDIIMEDMLKAVELIRYAHRFDGYIHLKVLPGSSYGTIKRASSLVQRLSINLEAPTKDHLSTLSTTKDYNIDIIRRQRWLSRMDLPHGHTTQFVVGAAGETDLEILKTLDYGYNCMNLKRGYFSAFTPCRHTALENREKTPEYREIRLYNTDFLLRKYGYKLKDIKEILTSEGNLKRRDPKLLIAENQIKKPLDINSATYSELIRVPGIGELSAKKIILARKKSPLTRRRELKNTGMILKRAEPFLKLNGWTQKRIKSYAS
ncbi:MAG: radical SAM protein [archaeon]